MKGRQANQFVGERRMRFITEEGGRTGREQRGVCPSSQAGQDNRDGGKAGKVALTREAPTSTIRWGLEVELKKGQAAIKYMSGADLQCDQR